MKKLNLTNSKNIGIIILSMFLFSASVISYSQVRILGSNLANNIKERIERKTEANSLFHNVVYYEECELEMAPAIARTIHVSSIEVIYEESIEVEAWMTSSFANNAEEYVEIEEWMTAPFETTLEESVPVESWMTAPFETTLEESVLVESWMTAPFEYSSEERLEVEEWMTSPFSNALEEKIATESWMTEPQAWLN